MPLLRRTTTALAALAALAALSLLTACGSDGEVAREPATSAPVPSTRAATAASTADADLARRFHRFAMTPSRGAPFVDGDVWVGIEDGLLATQVGPDERHDRAAWTLHGAYAEQVASFSALDVLRRSAGRYQLRPGVLPTCGHGRSDPPPALAGLRAVTLVVDEDAIASCLQWWAVTLFLDDADRIAGVALRLGSP